MKHGITKMTKPIEFRVCSTTTEDGEYFWIERKGWFGFWWIAEPGIWYNGESAERRATVLRGNPELAEVSFC